MTPAAPAVGPISVILPLYNGRRHIRAAIESILAQTLSAREIVVVDDGSSDGGADLLADYPGLTVIRQANTGEAAARNRGIRESRQPFIAFLDQDDLWLPDKLQLQLAAFAQEPAREAVFGRHRLFVEQGAPWQRPDLLDRPLSARLPGALMVRRGLFARIGPFAESMVLGSDVDWLWRASDSGVAFHAMAEEVLLRRIHAANASRNMAQFTTGLLEAAEASLKRKRR
jgi:glycosyltransferase involved in cell wall biosynthesis